MKIRLLSPLLFITQLWLVLCGVDDFGMYANPVLILIVSVSIAAIYFATITRTGDEAAPGSKLLTPVNSIFLLVFTLILLSSFISFVRIFHANPDTKTWTDVITQLEVLFDRTARGEQPYYPLAEYPWHPFPVYMPMHWLPVGIARLTGMDSRLVGLIMLSISIAAFVTLSIRGQRSIAGKAFLILATPVILLSFYLHNPIDVLLNLETIIAAYYLILAIGLYQKNLWLTTAGIILCLLSRYTVIFWLPLFAILLWVKVPRMQNLKVWGAVLLAILFIYVLPFYLREPSAFIAGIKYHNGAARDEWHTMGTFENGTYFAAHMKILFGGSEAHGVLMARIVQASFMLALLGGGLLAYRKVRDKVDLFDFSLGMLYLVLMCFYLFGPLTYRYYLITFIYISAVVCTRILRNMGSEPSVPLPAKA